MKKRSLVGYRSGRKAHRRQCGSRPRIEGKCRAVTGSVELQRARSRGLGFRNMFLMVWGGETGKVTTKGHRGKMRLPTGEN